jgi:hypothetical protein
MDERFTPVLDTPEMIAEYQKLVEEIKRSPKKQQKQLLNEALKGTRLKPLIAQEHDLLKEEEDDKPRQLMVGLYSLYLVYPWTLFLEIPPNFFFCLSLKVPWFLRPLNLKCDLLVSSLCFHMQRVPLVRDARDRRQPHVQGDQGRGDHEHHRARGGRQRRRYYRIRDGERKRRGTRD